MMSEGRNWILGGVLILGLAVIAVAGAGTEARVLAQMPTPLSTVTVPSGQSTPPSQCPPGEPVVGGEAPGVLFVVFRPGTPSGEQTAAHAAAGATPGEGQRQPAEDGSIGVTVTVRPGTEQAALQAYRSRPSVQSAMRVVISPPVCPTPTPTPGSAEQVPLVPGCNNLSLTWPNGTPTRTVALAVSPSVALVAIWRFETGSGRFLGWSPLPGAPNDLSTVNRLDAVFVCVSEPATLARPRA